MVFVPPNPATTEWVPIWNPVGAGPQGPQGPPGVIDAKWQNFTPAWLSASDPQPSGGVLVGRYVIIDKTCHFWVNLEFSAGATFGTSTWIFNYPVTASTAIQAEVVIGSAFLLDVDVEFRTGVALHYNVGQFLIIADHTGSFISPTVPFPWAVGDRLRVNGTYEIA